MINSRQQSIYSVLGDVGISRRQKLGLRHREPHPSDSLVSKSDIDELQHSVTIPETLRLGGNIDEYTFL